MNRIGRAALGVGLLVAGGVGLAAFGSARWARATQAQMALLEAAEVRAPTGMKKVYDAREIDGLPAPVQRYFRAVLKDGQPLIASATFELAGTINMSPTGDDWKPFTSWQRAVVHRPGFLWNGRVALYPGLAVHVHDSYIAGVGRLHAAMLGLFTVAEVRGDGEIARDELMRFFAEMAWYPTALLPSQGVHWEAVGQDMVMLPWDCTLSNYQLRHGTMVPTRGMVAKGGMPYFIGELTSLVYQF